jgi:hypothetical protein
VPRIPLEQLTHKTSHDDRLPSLPVYVRFRDLKAAGIVQNWQGIKRLVEEQGFPPGVMLGPNTRAWTVGDVRAGLRRGRLLPGVGNVLRVNHR